jgi:hypothetical protein
MNDIGVIHTRKGELILVDSDKLPELNRLTWGIDKEGYPYTNVGNRLTRRRVRMHKLLCDSKMVDHKNRIPWINCGWNLRPANDSQNGANKKKSSGCSSRFKGVTWDKERLKWLSRIKVNRKYYFLGYYENEHDAAIAYNGAAMLREFALLNKV